jgi:hypothetical protein
MCVFVWRSREALVRALRPGRLRHDFVARDYFSAPYTNQASSATQRATWECRPTAGAHAVPRGPFCGSAHPSAEISRVSRIGWAAGSRLMRGETTSVWNETRQPVWEVVCPSYGSKWEKEFLRNPGRVEGATTRCSVRGLSCSCRIRRFAPFVQTGMTRPDGTTRSPAVSRLTIMQHLNSYYFVIQRY